MSATMVGRKWTVPEPVRSPCSAIRCALTSRAGFPLVTTKRLHLRSIIYELLWLLSGDTNIKYLHDNKVTIWDEWADANGDLGPVYGAQWRSWPSRDGGVIDQIADTVERIKKNPDSRRLLVTAWNPADVDKMALPPCHCLFQFYVLNGKLSCQLYQRSADIFLGVPFNIASYALLTHMMAHVTGLKAGEFIHTLGDAHIYLNHLEQIDEQLSREPYALPRLVMKREVKAIDEFRYEDFEIVNYQAHPNISGVCGDLVAMAAFGTDFQKYTSPLLYRSGNLAGFWAGAGDSCCHLLVISHSPDSCRAGHLRFLDFRRNWTIHRHLMKSCDHWHISGLGSHGGVHLVGLKISRRRAARGSGPALAPPGLARMAASSSADFLIAMYVASFSIVVTVFQIDLSQFQTGPDGQSPTPVQRPGQGRAWSKWPMNRCCIGWRFLRSCIGAPLGEELVFRGYMFSLPVQNARWALRAPRLLTSALWALLHSSPSPWFLVGVILSWALPWAAC